MYDSLNRFMVRGIFKEMATSDDYEPTYTLKLEDYKGLPSAYKIYMSSVDEYDAAIKLVGNMRNWRKLCDCAWFMQGVPEVGHEGLEQWRKDMEMRDKSRSKAQLQDKALEGNVAAMTKLYNIGGVVNDGRIKKAKPAKKGNASKVVDIAKKIK